MVKNEEIKLTFADDMTCFLNDINSYLQLCRLLEDFYKYSGLRINNDKTELFAIGFIKLAQHDFIHSLPLPPLIFLSSEFLVYCVIYFIFYFLFFFYYFVLSLCVVNGK